MLNINSILSQSSRFTSAALLLCSEDRGRRKKEVDITKQEVNITKFKVHVLLNGICFTALFVCYFSVLPRGRGRERGRRRERERGREREKVGRRARKREREKGIAFEYKEQLHC